MKSFYLYVSVPFLLLSLFINITFGQATKVKPVTPNASPEVKALLDLIYNISGKYILTGQHNYPNIKNRNSIFAADYIGKSPVIYSTDWGFEKDGNTDSYLARPDIVREAIRQHQNGAIVTICWHAVPPTANEPVTFRPMPGAKPDSLASIQGQLTDQQFQDVLTPGTSLYKQWCTQVDSIAKYLKMLQEANVPILWRPYHEMNGNWFWWGGRQGKYSTTALYQQLFNRLVKHHKIINLVWVWSMDRPNNDAMQFKNFYPGNSYLDILALDVYNNDFKQENYDNLLALSEGKPIVLGEVGNPPAPEILEKQPFWAYYVVWAGMVRNTSKKQYENLSQNGRYLYQKDENYNTVLTAYRKAFNFPPIEVNDSKPAFFSGQWLFNEEKSDLGNTGASFLPYKLSILQQENLIEIQKTILLEYADNRIDTIKLSLDGKEFRSEMWNAPMITTANWLTGTDTLQINSKVNFTWDDRSFESVTKEKWVLADDNKTLIIEQYSNSFWGERNIKMFFDRVIGY
jgi:mannan endo-1,4-beta-mannosidase